MLTIKTKQGTIWIDDDGIVEIKKHRGKRKGIGWIAQSGFGLWSTSDLGMRHDCFEDALSELIGIYGFSPIFIEE